jgi:drug/metabolite transporter (DMT)-like permease
MIALLLSICQVISVAAQLALKTGMIRAGKFMRKPSTMWRLVLEPMLWLGGGLYVIGLILWLRILSVADLSFAYPFAAVAYAGGVLASQWILKERVTALRWAGVGLILIGLIFVATSGVSTIIR